MAVGRKVLVMQARNIGDGVIGTCHVQTIAAGLPGAMIDVLCRPMAEAIFAGNPAVRRVITGRFPMGSVGDFKLPEARKLLALVAELHRERYTDIVNMTGDFREELLARMIGTERSWSPDWAEDHPCRKIVRPSRIRLVNRPVFIPASAPSIYVAAGTVAAALAEHPGERPALFTADKQRLVWRPEKGLIGIHPSASQHTRQWSPEQWQECAGGLLREGFRVKVFGAPGELRGLEETFGTLKPCGLEIVTGNIAGFFRGLAEVEVFLCHDSFAAHVAYAIGVPIVFLNGANDARAWMPPGSELCAAGPGMACYPCYNRPTCVGTGHQYGCVLGISVASVEHAVERCLARSAR